MGARRGIMSASERAQAFYRGVEELLDEGATDAAALLPLGAFEFVACAGTARRRRPQQCACPLPSRLLTRLAPPSTLSQCRPTRRLGARAPRPPG